MIGSTSSDLIEAIPCFCFCSWYPPILTSTPNSSKMPRKLFSLTCILSRTSGGNCNNKLITLNITLIHTVTLRMPNFTTHSSPERRYFEKIGCWNCSAFCGLKCPVFYEKELATKFSHYIVHGIFYHCRFEP